MTDEKKTGDKTPEPPEALPVAGWYRDPAGKEGDKRYWDGSKWTDHKSSPENPYKQAAATTSAATPTQKKPFYKRPWPIAGMSLAALFIIAAIAGGGNDTTSSSSSDSSSDQSSASAEPPTATVGEPVDVEGTRYEVLSVKTASRVGDQYLGEDANGTFVIVKLELTNLKDETRTIVSNAITLIGGNGKSYEASTDALIAVDDAIFLEEIQPDLPEKGTVVYDIPSSAISGSKLRVEDLFSDANAEIDLGL